MRTDGSLPRRSPDGSHPRPGPVAVTVLDADNADAHGFAHHAASPLAVLDRSRVFALPTPPTEPRTVS
ncbi:hypothetical protein OG749_47200 (plasmid) [Streptomyces nojiriensis]|uniref:hypothetical protein n=1 Tax=Streptomyces nojiriensis TaxID=66374 RepID=UPI002E1902BD